MRRWNQSSGHKKVRCTTIFTIKIIMVHCCTILRISVKIRPSTTFLKTKTIACTNNKVENLVVIYHIKVHIFVCVVTKLRVIVQTRSWETNFRANLRKDVQNSKTYDLKFWPHTSSVILPKIHAYKLCSQRERVWHRPIILHPGIQRKCQQRASSEFAEIPQEQNAEGKNIPVFAIKRTLAGMS